MQLNNILFPAPAPSYNEVTFGGELIWIPRSHGKGNPNIPALVLQCPRGSSKILLYFHGNAEDVGLAYELMDHIRSTLLVHVMAMEYPNYGIYPGKCTADQVICDAENVFEFLTNQCNVHPRDIIIFGRSIGTGPATWLASQRNPGALLLMSAYTSIRAVVKNVAGSFVKFLVKERFRNIDLISQVTCPTFIIHGQKDKLIPFSNSQELHEKCGGPSTLILPKEMDHNEFDFYDDLSLPFSNFLSQCGISVFPESAKTAFLPFPAEYYNPPDDAINVKNKGRWNRFFRLFNK